KRGLTFLRFASHAGEMRVFEYALAVGAPVPRPLLTPNKSGREDAVYERALAGGTIRTTKRLTYSRSCNPWRQLSEMTVEEFPHLIAGKRPPLLKLEPKFFARLQKHLMQMVLQRDHATALFEMGSFLLTIVRILLTTHIWSFRLPDAPTAD